MALDRCGPDGGEPCERRNAETAASTPKMPHDLLAAAPADRDTLNRAADHADPHVRHSSPISTESPSFGQERLAEILSRRLGPAATFATTEHFNLQTARSITVSESNGRASIYLAALSSNLIALAFIGETSRLGAAFHAFALILLPVLTFIGVATFERLVQSSIEDIAYARRIGRLRGFYLDLAPELEPYFVLVRSTGGTPYLEHNGHT